MCVFCCTKMLQTHDIDLNDAITVSEEVYIKINNFRNLYEKLKLKI